MSSDARPEPATPLDAGLLSPVRAGTRTEAATGDHAYLAAMLDAEAALARAQARLGIVPGDAAAAIAAAADPARFDLTGIARRARGAGNPVVPPVADLRDLAAAAEHVHRGATSQDIVDTGAMLVAARARRVHPRGARRGARRPGRPRRPAPRHPDGRPHPRPARAADHVRREGRELAAGLPGGPRPAGRGRAAGAGAPAAAGRSTRPATARRNWWTRSPPRPAWTGRCCPGTPAAPRSPTSAPRSPSPPGPSARSPPTCSSSRRARSTRSASRRTRPRRLVGDAAQAQPRAVRADPVGGAAGPRARPGPARGAGRAARASGRGSGTPSGSRCARRCARGGAPRPPPTLLGGLEVAPERMRADLDALLAVLGRDPGPGAAPALVDRALDAYRGSRT
ncbi:hypothetical protein [Actinomadura sp. CNU-125]|uniref:hypothetical protein n=1 Tax=Actinomadura sp. CNU-125 TaxID=1904961 RepID=UPI000AE05F57|nr:hypothetical protein [Actinomadura sp. CNU-125]